MDRGAPDEAGIGAHESFAAAAATVPTASVLCKRVAVTGPKELRAVVPEDAVVAAAAAAAAGISESREQSPRQRSPGAGNESRLASSTTATAATKEQPTNTHNTGNDNKRGSHNTRWATDYTGQPTPQDQQRTRKRCGLGLRTKAAA